MKPTRRGAGAVLAALGLVIPLAFSCASKPAQVPESLQATPTALASAPLPVAASDMTASTAAADAGAPAATAVDPAPAGPGTGAGTTPVGTTPIGKAPDEARPELSFPRRPPFSQMLIIASLNEPSLPAAKVRTTPKPEPLPAAATVAAPSPAVEPAPSAAAPMAAAAPAAPTAVPVLPKPAAAIPAAKPPAPVKTVPAASAPAAKLPEPAPNPKNLASPQAVYVDPVAEKKPDIARNFSTVQGTRFEVPFEGTGWTYLGEKTGREGIAYDSRRFAGSSLIFVLNPVKAGEYLLRFQRQDSLRGISYEELVGVSVAEKPVRPAASGSPATAAGAAATAVAATAAGQAGAGAPPILAPGTAAGAATGGAAGGAVAQGAAAAATAQPVKAAPQPPAVVLDTPEAALIQARSELAAGRAQGALEALDRLLVLAPTGTDEAFVLYGRALEKNGPQKDIKRAYDYYRKIRDEYPESPFWDEASARALYIERHYFDIR